MPASAGRPLEVNGRVAMRGARRGLLSGTTEVLNGLVPDLAEPGMVSESLNLVGAAIDVDSLDRLDELRVKPASSLRQQTAVRRFVSERVLERILDVGKQAR